MKQKKFEPDLWEVWNKEIKLICEASNNLYIAIFSLEGDLLFANKSMESLFKEIPKDSFINPTFDKLINSNIDNEIITIGSIKSTKNTSLKASVIKKAKQILIIGEIDVSTLLSINDNLFDLNSEITSLHRKLIKEKLELKETLAELKISEYKVIESEEKIKKLLSEKELLLREVHHRIKNNMNSINAILSLQAKMLKEPSAIAALRDSGTRIQSMMLLYNKLYKSEISDELEIKEYISSLIDEIAFNFPNKSIVKIEKNIEDFKINSKLLFHLGIIITEIITNIMKYAFIGRNSGLIKVDILIKEKKVTISIKDNGNGIPSSIDVENPTTFGLMLIQTLTKQIEGNIEIKNEQGTIFLLNFEI